MAKKQKKNIKLTSNKKAPVKQTAKSEKTPQVPAVKSHKSLIFKIVIWTLMVLFFGGINMYYLQDDISSNETAHMLASYYSASETWFFVIYGLGILLWGVLLFLKQERNRKNKIIFTVFIASIVLSIVIFIMYSMDMISKLCMIYRSCIFLAIYIFSPIVLALKPKKVLWYLFYLLLGFCVAISGFVMDYVLVCDEAKPIIYLYPTKETHVSVKVGYPEKFTHTYPHYIDGWNVIAQPNGDLKDVKTGRNLYALYWEGKEAKKDIHPKEGFIVKGEDTIAFLEDKLAQLGLSEREANEFIIYWLPKLEDEKYNYIRFKTMEEQDENMPLFVEPKPDTVIRVMMEYDDLDEPIDVKEQVLPPTPQRKGFTLVEWGGTEIDI